MAIDYTNSNKPWNQPDSLHSQSGFNQYQAAIQSVGGILECYDTDRKIPVYGFGGIPHYMNEQYVSHCFPLNGNAHNPEIQGIQNVLNTYRQTIQVS
jgi:Copine